MPLIEPLSSDDLPRFGDLAQFYQSRGYLPNNLLTMARLPDMLRGMHEMHSVVMQTRSRVTAELKVLIEHVVSGVAGCRYCQAHTALHSVNRHENTDRLDKVWEFRTSQLFTEAERAALELAAGAGITPNAVTEDMRQEARRHWSDDELAEIVAVIAFMGFINRWNDTVATPLEDAPKQFATENLASHGWELGRH